jgi:O-antigen ligase
MSRVRHGLAGPLLASRLTQLIVAVGASAIAARLIASGNTHTLAAGAVALVVVGALMRWPAFTLVSLLIVCQELDPGLASPGTSSGGLLYLGYQVYFRTVGRVSLLTLVVLLALGRVLIATRPFPPRRTAVIFVLALGAYIALLLWADGTSLTSAINQDARFAILFGGCFGVGVAAANSREWARNAVPVFQWLLSGMVVLGLYLAATGQGQGPTGDSVIFYDAATGAIAGAAMLAAVLTPSAQRTGRLWWIAGAGLLVVILSARRDVWAAIIVALLLSLMFAQDRMRLILRLLAGAGVGLLVLAVVVPSALTGIGHQLSAIWGATQGTAADASVKGHLSDISVGWSAVKASPFSGVGPSGHVAGLVAEGTGPLYIHNQVLETWLRFGLLGAVIVIAIQLVLLVQGLVTLRRPGIEFSARWAATLLIMAPVSLLTAPFLTTTQRWPAILGFAAGVIAPVLRAPPAVDPAELAGRSGAGADPTPAYAGH